MSVKPPSDGPNGTGRDAEGPDGGSHAQAFHDLVEGMIHGVVIHRDWRALYCNQAYAALLGFDGPHEVVALPSIAGLIAAHDRTRLRNYRDARMRGAEAPTLYQFDVVRRDGRVVTVDGASARIDWEGAPAIYTTITDATERSRVEAALRESELRFRDFTRSAGDWFWELDEQLRFTYISERFEEVTGIPCVSAYGKTRFELALMGVEHTTREMRLMWIRHVEDLRNRRPFRDFVYRLHDPSGTPRHVKINGLPIYDAAGRFRGYRGTGADVTREIAAAERARAAEQRFVQALEHISDGYALFDASDRLVTCNSTYRYQINPAVAHLLEPGVGFETLLRAMLARGEIVEARGREDEWLVERLARRAQPTEPFELRRSGGIWQQVREHRAADGSTVMVVSDITMLKLREQALAHSESRFRDFAETAADWFWELDEGLRFTYLSERYEQVTGVPRSKLMGLEAHEALRIFGVEPEQHEEFMRSLRERQPFENMEVEHTRHDSSLRVFSLSGRPFHSDDGRFLGYRGTGRDVTRARLDARRMAWEARHDALTGLVNRREFQARLARALDASRKGAGEHVLCYLDLDHFKQVNDRFGHAAGDRLLEELAAMLRERVRGRDTVGRLGGDEFGLLMEHCPLEHAVRSARGLCEAVQAFRFRWHDHEIQIGVSIGVVSLTGHAENVQDLLAKADRACYAAKHAGRGAVRVAS
ncbi:MAG: diguanylate cyclase [Ectothiorhodospiraceae bacterium]|nr:diguanylate cyclase [Chromatiales bacterium]MCP5153810.1 diguanylate cyclase [Ectothiorhodospiraceae bacterium]